MRKLRAVLILALMCFLWRPSSVLANGHSKTLYLSGLPGITNLGPTDAMGTAKVNVGEGYIELEATGLPVLSGEIFQVWVATADLGTWASFGRFVGVEGVPTVYSATVDGLPLEDYRYLILSVEPEPDDSPAPSGRNLVAAVFPNPDAAPSSAAATAVASGVGAAPTSSETEAQTSAAAEVQASPQPVLPGSTPPPPSYLPETGAANNSYGGAWSLGALVVGLAAAARLRRPQ